MVVVLVPLLALPVRTSAVHGMSGQLGGRIMATRMRMQDVAKPDQYTELEYLDMDFDVDVPDRMFTLFSLQSGRNR